MFSARAADVLKLSEAKLPEKRVSQGPHGAELREPAELNYMQVQENSAHVFSGQRTDLNRTQTRVRTGDSQNGR